MECITVGSSLPIRIDHSTLWFDVRPICRGSIYCSPSQSQNCLSPSCQHPKVYNLYNQSVCDPMPCNQLVEISYFPLRPQNWKTSILRSVGADWGGRPALSPGLVGTKVSPSATLGSAGVLQRVVTQPVRCTPLAVVCLSCFVYLVFHCRPKTG